MKLSTSRGRWPGRLLLLPLLVLGVALAPVVGPSLPKCFFHEKTGALCPGCGATRSAMALQAGRWGEAIQSNIIFAGGVVFGGIWLLLVAVRELYTNSRWLRVFRFRLEFLWIALAALVVFWVVRNLPWFDFLRPG